VTAFADETVFFWGDGAGRLDYAKYGGPWAYAFRQDGTQLWARQWPSLHGSPCGFSVTSSGQLALGLADGEFMQPEIRSLAIQFRTAQSERVLSEIAADSPMEVGVGATALALAATCGLFAVSQTAASIPTALVEVMQGRSRMVWTPTVQSFPAEIPRNALTLSLQIVSVKYSPHRIYLLVDYRYYDSNTGRTSNIALLVALNDDYIVQWSTAVGALDLQCNPRDFTVAPGDDLYILCDVLTQGAPSLSRIFKIKPTGYQDQIGWPQDLTAPSGVSGQSISSNFYGLYVAGTIDDGHYKKPIVAGFGHDGSPAGVWTNSFSQESESWEKIRISAINGYFFLGAYVKTATGGTPSSRIHDVRIAKYDRYGILA
jgi:hypothetical protein